MWRPILLLILAVPATQSNFASPKSAAKSLYHAIEAGDRDAVRAGLYAENEQQEKLAGAMADLIVAGKKLGDAARMKFGASGAEIGRGALDPAALSRLEEATVDQKGDVATITVPQQTRP